MAQSFSSVYIHLVFSTKNRIPCLDPELCSRLWSYLGGTCRSMGCNPVQVGGTSDHVHILCVLARDTAIQNFVAKIKAESSKWVKCQKPLTADFHWQTGYGVFSVNPKERQAVVQYIADQKEHHRNRTFQEEFVMFLKKYDIAYDEKYLWD